MILRGLKRRREERAKRNALCDAIEAMAVQAVREDFDRLRKRDEERFRQWVHRETLAD